MRPSSRHTPCDVNEGRCRGNAGAWRADTSSGVCSMRSCCRPVPCAVTMPLTASAGAGIWQENVAGRGRKGHESRCRSRSRGRRTGGRRAGGRRRCISAHLLVEPHRWLVQKPDSTWNGEQSSQLQPLTLGGVRGRGG